jgi:hemerythrin
MVTDDEEASGISAETLEAVRQTYAVPVDLKKVDVGGGMIHGRAADYVDDTSKRILLSHVARPLTSAEKEIGSSTSFGMQDVLIPSRQDYAHQKAERYLGSYFPTAQPCHLQLLLNNPIVSFNVDTILIRRGEHSPYIYLVLGGVVEYVESGGGVNNTLSAGALLGDLAGLLESPAKGTYRAASNVQALQMPRNLYTEFVVRCDLLGAVRRKHALRQFLKRTYLFGEVVSHPIQDRIAQAMELRDLGPDDTVEHEHEGEPTARSRSSTRASASSGPIAWKRAASTACRSTPSRTSRASAGSCRSSTNAASCPASPCARSATARSRPSPASPDHRATP